ncbi:MAG: RDD family protein [Myxococcota bacterium]
MVTERRVPPFLLRGVARAIDLAVQFFLMEAAFAVSAYLPSEGLVSIGEDALFYVDLGVGLGAMVLYATLAEWLGGATFGKFCTGLRVLSADGDPIDLKAAFIRSFAFFIDGLFFGLVAYSAVMRSLTGQRLGDEWADTVVVWRGDAPETVGWRGWPVGMIAALALVVASYLVAT